MSMSNVYHARKVADTDARPCDVCFKPTSTVLNQENSKDFFFICIGHLSDRGFASPIVNEEEEAQKKKQAELDAEVERLKKEFEEKQKRKKEKEKEKEKDKDKKDEDKDKDKEKDKKEKEKEKEKEKDKEKTEDSKTVKKPDAPQRVFKLHRDIFAIRLAKIRNKEIARKNQERLRNPDFFAPIPKD